MELNYLIILFTAACFLFYGLNCLLSQKMVLEFQRYGLADQRKLTGVLQLLGVLGLIVGLWFFPSIGFLAALGLTILMLLGFGVRIKIKDSFKDSFPSFFFMLINAYISIYFYQSM